VFDLIVPPDCENWGVVVGSWVGFDSTYDGGCCSYWGEGDFARRHECCCVVLFVLFLYFEGDVDAIGVLEGWVVVAEELTVLKNRRFRTRRISVLRFLCCWTLTYSHKRMTKKKARVGSWEMVRCSGMRYFFAILAMMQVGITFCCFSFGSSFL